MIQPPKAEEKAENSSDNKSDLLSTQNKKFYLGSWKFKLSFRKTDSLEKIPGGIDKKFNKGKPLVF